MALQPYSFSSREVLQPGARGEMFKNNGIPGHRTDDARINRTQNALLTSEHDTLNIKYALDPRLKPLFRYGWAYGYNQIVLPKGRIVAADPHLCVMDTETMHYFNAVTLANGGKVVELQSDNTWKAVVDTFEVDTATGKDKNKPNTLRDKNIPLGMIGRNEYTRNADAFNGIMPGPIWTDKLVDLPWFVEKTKAEENPWGCVYGELKPGQLLKADENGRITISPLSLPDKTKVQGGMSDMTAAEIEAERQQVIGTVYATDKSLLPEGAARFAQWSLDDRRNFNDYNPYVWPNSNRAGEDFVSNAPTAYQSDLGYPGYPYDKNYISNDLHMLASSREGAFDPRLDEAMRLDRGIPGLMDGGNHAAQEIGTGETLTITHIVAPTTTDAAQEMMIRLPETALESAKVKLDNESAVSIAVNATVQVGGATFTITYADMHKGLFALKHTAGAGDGQSHAVNVSYKKKGLIAGMPTMLDWDGCVGIAQILLQK